MDKKSEITREGTVGSPSWSYIVNNYDESGKEEPYSYQMKFGAELAVIIGTGLPEHYILKNWNSYRDSYQGSILNPKKADKLIRLDAYEHAKKHTGSIENIIDMTEEKEQLRKKVEKRKREISKTLVFNP